MDLIVKILAVQTNKRQDSGLALSFPFPPFFFASAQSERDAHFVLFSCSFVSKNNNLESFAQIRISAKNDPDCFFVKKSH